MNTDASRTPSPAAYPTPATHSMIRNLERACDSYESAWTEGRRPSLEDYLVHPGSPGREGMLRELLVLELIYRRRAGERPMRREYAGRFPDHAEAIAAVFASQEPTKVDGTGDEPPGDQVPAIPGYTVLEELGRGGMGVVFKATAEQLNRFVALKMILAGDLAGPEAAARFRTEAEAVARLQHPQVVQIFRIGDHDGRPFLEMEYRRRRQPGGPARRPPLAPRRGRPAGRVAGRWPSITPTSGGSSTAT